MPHAFELLLSKQVRSPSYWKDSVTAVHIRQSWIRVDIPLPGNAKFNIMIDTPPLVLIGLAIQLRPALIAQP